VQKSLLGDKLTAFAAHTIGVPLTEQFSQQVIKQLLDIAQLSNHLINDRFSLPQAKVAAANAACLSKILLSESKPSGFPQFDISNIQSIKEATIETRHDCLNRLKVAKPEAFFYWI